VLAVLLLFWALAAAAAIVLCAAARRGDQELELVRPTVLQTVDGNVSRRTRAS
jgi:hypothetical protein